MSKYKLCIIIALFVVIIYGSLLSYFCLAKPDNLQKVIAKQTQQEFEASAVVASPQINQQKAQASSDIKIPNASQKTLSVQECFTFYIGEITDFYELIITLLLSVIGVLLVISFVYVHFTSKKQAEEFAHEAVQSRSFNIVLADIVNKKITDFKNSDELMEIYAKLPDIEERLIAVEKEIDKEGYDLIKEEGGEK